MKDNLLTDVSVVFPEPAIPSIITAMQSFELFGKRSKLQSLDILTDICLYAYKIDSKLMHLPKQKLKVKIFYLTI